jgi:hypothetical protein
MMPQKEVNEAIHQQADPDYGRYEGNQTSSARQHYETSYEQELRGEPSGKVYPLPRDNTNIRGLLWFVVAIVALLAFAVVCLVIVGGTAGWISFCAASFAIMTLAGVGIIGTRVNQK